ncbi:hypothetical protein B7494_g7240 [Chlorociboria aeruginascens]|nr:hypothetical protein B7494_g7240 [Chlorociboria aeruginascens]
MSALSNPLVTADQLYQKSISNTLPIELQDSIRYYTSRLTQAAGILLRLPQDVTARANVLLYRYWVVDDLMEHEFSACTCFPIFLGNIADKIQDVSAAIVYLTAKISPCPRSLRSITNVYAYLLSSSSQFSSPSTPPRDPESYYLSESAYITQRTLILHIEGQILNALGFNTHSSLPHPLALTYLQFLDCFNDKVLGKRVAQKTIQYLNTALLSPQMLYLTHQPNALATASIYLAAREEGLKLPDTEWWEVFDCEREELGFLVVGMRSLEGLARRSREIWGSKGMITRRDVKEELDRRGLNGYGNEDKVEDEEAEMARLMDERLEDN